MACSNGLNRLAAATLIAACLGCGGDSQPTQGFSIADQLDAQVDTDAEAADTASRKAKAAEARAKADALAAAGTTAIEATDMERGKHVQGGGYLRTVVRGGIRAEQKINDIVVTHTMKSFWATEGRWPKDHDEFMEKVVKAYDLTLEPLQEPYEYWYNPEDHQLYKRVKQEAIDAAEAEAQAAEAEAAEN